MKYDISIIVPGRNIEKLFPFSIESLLRQDFKGTIEIILVDDESEDNSYEIIKEYAEKYKNIKAFRIKHGGPGAARNMAIQNASGKWLMFVDGDDYVENNFCRLPYEIALKYDPDIVWFNYEYDPINYRKVLAFDYEGIKELNKEEALKGCLIANGNVCWNKLYKTSFFKQFSFPEHTYYEDAALLYKVIGQANKIYWLNEKLYHYRKTGKSITNTFTIKSLNDYFKCHIDQGEYIKKYYPQLYKEMAYFYVEVAIVYACRIRKEDAIKEYYEKCQNILKEYNLPSPPQFKKQLLRFMFNYLNPLFNFLANLTKERRYAKEDSL